MPHKSLQLNLFHVKYSLVGSSNFMFPIIPPVSCKQTAVSSENKKKVVELNYSCGSMHFLKKNREIQEYNSISRKKEKHLPFKCLVDGFISFLIKLKSP